MRKNLFKSISQLFILFSSDNFLFSIREMYCCYSQTQPSLMTLVSVTTAAQWVNKAKEKLQVARNVLPSWRCYPFAALPHLCSHPQCLTELFPSRNKPVFVCSLALLPPLQSLLLPPLLPPQPCMLQKIKPY